MINDQSEGGFRSIEQTPVQELMQLSIAELDGFIRQAALAVENAQTLREWLTWIKAEKLLREDPDNGNEGDQHES